MKFLTALLLPIATSAFGAVKLNAGPRFTAPNATHILKCHSEQMGDYERWVLKGNKAPDGSHLFFGELGAMGLLPNGRYVQMVYVGVPHVFASGTPFEILDTVVCLNAILVINFLLLWVVGLLNKRQRNKSSNRSVDIPSVFAKVYHYVSQFVGSCLKDGFSTCRGGIPPNAAHIANGVHRALRYCFPFLRSATDLVRHFQPFSSRLSLFRCEMRRQLHLVPPFWASALAATSLFAMSATAAVPAYTSFRGTGGILVTSNPPIGTIVIDGSGVFTSSGTNATISVSTNGVLVAVASTNINFTAGRSRDN